MKWSCKAFPPASDFPFDLQALSLGGWVIGKERVEGHSRPDFLYIGKS